jgi:hypothetical protein
MTVLAGRGVRIVPAYPVITVSKQKGVVLQLKADELPAQAESI